MQIPKSRDMVNFINLKFQQSMFILIQKDNISIFIFSIFIFILFMNTLLWKQRLNAIIQNARVDCPQEQIAHP